jgi:adenine-specific DNA-methyltransferase
MLITYNNKKSEKDILEKTPRAKLRTISGKGAKNKLIHADNLFVLKALLDDYAGKVDLVYIDPPFATNGHFKISEDRANTISSSNRDAIAYSDILIGDDFLEFCENFCRNRVPFIFI